MEQMSLFQLYEDHIRDTEADAVVIDITILLCHLTYAVKRGGSFESLKVHLNSRMLKHVYDKRPAEEFHTILKYLINIVRYPDLVYKNLDTKKGDLIFLKRVNSSIYICSIEKGLDQVANERVNYVVTCFRLRKESYLKSYQLIWSWKGDIPSS